MPTRRVLFLENDRLTAFRVAHGGVVREAGFAADPAGPGDFGRYLERQRGRPLLLLADLAEEGFESEDIPRVGGKDRESILRRRLSRHFFGTPYALALPQGRAPDGRRDERVLLMALTRPERLSPWLDALRGRQAPLAGVWSLPQLVAGLLPQRTPQRLLLLTRTGAGLRQTFFAAGQLRFSRLTPAVPADPAAAAQMVRNEAARMRQYLASQRLIGQNDPLAVRLLVHPDEMTALRAQCPNDPGLPFELVDLAEQARRAGLRTALADSRAEMLFCHLLARRRPPQQFAPDEERRPYRLRQARRALHASSILVLMGGALFAAGHWQSIPQAQDFPAEPRDATRMNAPIEIPLGADALRALVDRYAEVARRAPGPAPLLAQLGQSLDVFLPVSLDHLEWAIVERVPGIAATGPYAQITATARLPAQTAGDRQAQETLIADFVRHLETVPDTHAAVLEPPTDPLSGGTLRSGDARRVPEPPRFVFRLARRL